MTSADHPPAASTAGAGPARAGRTLDVPLLPGATAPTACPRRHDLQVAGARHGWSQDYHAPEFLCEACHSLPDRGGRWALINPAVSNQVLEDNVTEAWLQLVVCPPPVPAGVGMIQLRWGTTIYGQIALSLCRIERRGLVLSLEVEPRHRRRGVGQLLVAAARTRGAGYDWSSNSIGTDPIVVAFWARIGAPRVPAQPCSHQAAASVITDHNWDRWW